MRQEIPDPQVKDAAEQYFNAWKELYKLPPGSGVLLPLMNTATVAIELYLKCLCSEKIFTPVDFEEGIFIVTAKPQKHGHDFIEIFKKIPESYRYELTKQYTSFFENNSRNFEHIISELEGAFMQSRYPYEADFDVSKFNLQDLCNLCEFLSNFVSNLEVTDTVYL
ncbi:hypothetical protein SHEWT2_03859 [Shewanella hafniensis]|jgi:hypothetical protein|nr:hypothetical protein SHEWT2_03859 [Shewanella hafniensis]